jgi:hypothetical protein
MNEDNNLSDLPKDIPFTEKSFQIDVQGNLTKKRYLGDFTCQIPNIKEQCLMKKHEASLNGDMVGFLDPGTINMHKMISHLRFTLKEYPSFWKNSELGYTLRDPNVVKVVYDEVLAFETEWLKAIWGEEEDVDGEEDEKENS